MKNFSRELETIKRNQMYIFKLKTEIRNSVDDFIKQKRDYKKGLDIFWEPKCREFLISRPALKEIQSAFFRQKKNDPKWKHRKGIERTERVNLWISLNECLIEFKLYGELKNT